MRRSELSVFAISVLFGLSAGAQVPAQRSDLAKSLVRLNRDLIDALDAAAETPRVSLHIRLSELRQIERRAEDIHASMAGKHSRTKRPSDMGTEERAWSCLGNAALDIGHNASLAAIPLSAFSQMAPADPKFPQYREVEAKRLGEQFGQQRQKAVERKIEC